MPELPEVEHIVRYLRRRVRRARILRLAFLEEDRYLRGTRRPAFARDLRGRTVAAVERRGKWIVFSLSGERRLVVHLKLTGKLRVEPSVRRESPVRWAIEFADGRALVYEDARKFGWVACVSEGEFREMESALGPEPLGSEFDLEAFAARAASRRVRAKAVLLDQGFVAGIGNIYADEILFDARIDPRRVLASLDRSDIARLHGSIRGVLARAVAERSGVPDQERVGGGGRGPARRLRLAVYQRAGEPCPRCRGSIARIVVASRGTYFCPACQPPATSPSRGSRPRRS